VTASASSARGGGSEAKAGGSIVTGSGRTGTAGRSIWKKSERYTFANEGAITLNRRFTPEAITTSRQTRGTGMRDASIAEAE
jgi:hypothetical protein